MARCLRLGDRGRSHSPGWPHASGWRSVIIELAGGSADFREVSTGEDANLYRNG
jgi:hypothetical protein